MKDENREARELKKLHRQDLLELLLSQSKDVARQQDELERLQRDLKETKETCERLKGKLDDKDAQIEHLKERLNQKDARIAQLQAGGLLPVKVAKNGSADAVRIGELFDVARDAAGEYLQKLLGEVSLKDAENGAQTNRSDKSKH